MVYYLIGKNLMRYDGRTYYRTDPSGAWVRDPALARFFMGDGDAQVLTTDQAKTKAEQLFPGKHVEL